MADSTYQLKTLSYTHEALVDAIIANPTVSQGQLAARFGVTPGWLSRILRSDAIREMIAKRKGELVDPLVMQSIETRLLALADQAMTVLQEKLDASPNAEVALKALEISTRAAGYGVARGTQVNVNAQTYVVAMPAKEPDSAKWVEAYSGRAPIEAAAGG